MDIVEAIQRRRSIRAFKPDPVPRQVLEEVLSLAVRSPSWANTQPWEFAVVCGAELDRIREALLAHANDKPEPDLPGPGSFPEPYNRRRRDLMTRMAELMGREQQNAERLRNWQTHGLALYGAPAAIFIYTDRSFCFQDSGLNVWPVFDCGLVAQNIILLATNHGLGTIAQMQAAHRPAMVKEVLGIPESKLIVLGIAIGYPDWEDAVNALESERDGLDVVAKWYGF